jgi:hypothetical protein
VVLTLLCLVLFGLFQVSQGQVAQAVVEHAAVVAARARAVGFNDFMVYKVTRVATIPTAGRMTSPVPGASSADPDYWGTVRAGAAFEQALQAQPASPQFGIERSRIPLYLGAEHGGDLQAILDYDAWDTVSNPALSDVGPDLVRARVRQQFPLRMPFHRAFYAADALDLSGEARMDSHYSLYLE